MTDNVIRLEYYQKINWEAWESPASFEITGEGFFTPETPLNWFRVFDPKLPALKEGWTYRVSLDGKFYLVRSLPETNYVIPIKIRFGRDQKNYHMVAGKQPCDIY